MATNYQQDGRTIDYQNTGETEIQSGEAVVVGALVGVAHDDILAGLGGVLHTFGVFVLPKAAESIVTGQKLYLADGKVTAEAGETAAPNPLAGTAWADAEAGDETVAVRLGF
ncbi:capsid cement protein [Pantoea anthophila]|uniref:capsid cement protein n=1 Tax=Pantoea anthophila TaxID=470931 RepID=UPI00301D04DD